MPSKSRTGCQPDHPVIIERPNIARGLRHSRSKPIETRRVGEFREFGDYVEQKLELEAN